MVLLRCLLVLLFWLFVSSSSMLSSTFYYIYIYIYMIIHLRGYFLVIIVCKDVLQVNWIEYVQFNSTSPSTLNIIFIILLTQPNPYYIYTYIFYIYLFIEKRTKNKIKTQNRTRYVNFCRIPSNLFIKKNSVLSLSDYHFKLLFVCVFTLIFYFLYDQNDILNMHHVDIFECYFFIYNVCCLVRYAFILPVIKLTRCSTVVISIIFFYLDYTEIYF